MEMTIGKRIALLRREKKLKQEELAEMLNVSPQAVSKWENDLTCPDISLLPKLAKILGVTVDELLSGKKEPVVKAVEPKDSENGDVNDKILRINVVSNNSDKVRVNLPMPLVQAAIDMGLDIPQISGNETLKGIDLNKIVELINSGVVGNLVEIETRGGDVVNIFVE